MATSFQSNRGSAFSSRTKKENITDQLWDSPDYRAGSIPPVFPRASQIESYLPTEEGTEYQGLLPGDYPTNYYQDYPDDPVENPDVNLPEPFGQVLQRKDLDEIRDYLRYYSQHYLNYQPVLVNQRLPDGRLPLRLLTQDSDIPIMAELITYGLDLNPGATPTFHGSLVPERSPLLDVDEPNMFYFLFQHGARIQTEEEREELYTKLFQNRKLPIARYPTGRPMVDRDLPVCSVEGLYIPVVRYEKILDEPLGSKFYFYEPASNEQLQVGNCLLAGSKYEALAFLFDQVVQIDPHHPALLEAQIQINQFTVDLMNAYPEIPVEDLLMAYSGILYNELDQGYGSKTVDAHYCNQQGEYLSGLRGLDFDLNEILVTLGRIVQYDTIILQRQPFKHVSTLVLSLTESLICTGNPRPHTSDYIWYHSDGLVQIK